MVSRSPTSPGNCAKGISLANVRNAEIRDIKVTGVSGPLIGVNNATGSGLEGAATIDLPPKVPDAVPPAAAPYRFTKSVRAWTR